MFTLGKRGKDIAAGMDVYFAMLNDLFTRPLVVSKPEPTADQTREPPTEPEHVIILAQEMSRQKSRQRDTSPRPPADVSKKTPGNVSKSVSKSVSGKTSKNISGSPSKKRLKTSPSKPPETSPSEASGEHRCLYCNKLLTGRKDKKYCTKPNHRNAAWKERQENKKAGRVR